jgi:hypothetical protein
MFKLAYLTFILLVLTLFIGEIKRPPLTLSPSEIKENFSPASRKVLSLESQKIIEDLKAKIIPAQNTQTPYGLAFNDHGYHQLLSFEKDIKLEEGLYKNGLARKDVFLPCCRFDRMKEDYSENCQCGHHLALYGLGKKLIQLGSTEQVQSEIDRWKRFFFPREYLQMELEKSASATAEVRRALEEFKSEGGC